MSRGELIVASQIKDPVIERKRKKLESIERMANIFKRIDIKFLTIPEKGATKDKPAFAILPLKNYANRDTCTFSGSYSWDGSTGEFSDMFSGTSISGYGTAIPPSPPTDEALAIAEKHGHEFDRIMVAWEADWSENTGDPLMIGEIDHIWFLMAKWDMTKLESFIASEADWM